MSYLDKFKSVIGSVQTEQILKLLNGKRNTGEIRSVQEFSKELESLIREITSTGLKPTLSLYNAEQNKKITSDTYNFMLDRTQDDLEAGFKETIQIDKIQQAHSAIVRDVLLKKNLGRSSRA